MHATYTDLFYACLEAGFQYKGGWLTCLGIYCDKCPCNVSGDYSCVNTIDSIFIYAKAGLIDLPELLI